MNLNNLKIKNCIAKPNTYLKSKGLHNVLIPDMISEVVLLEIYKLNKFSGPIPKILCFCLFTCPDIWKHATSLDQILFTNIGFCSIWWVIKLQTDSCLLLATLMFCFICILQVNVFKSFLKMLYTFCCTLLLISSPDLITFYSVHGKTSFEFQYCWSNCINFSRWSPSFLSTTWGTSNRDPVF